MDAATDTLHLSRPVTPLWRSPGVLQLDAQASVVLSDVPARAAQAIKLLTTPQTPTTLRQLMPDLDEEWLAGFLAELARAGLLHADRLAGRPCVAVVGSGPLALELVDALDQAGFGPTRRLASSAEGSYAAVPHWSRYLGPWADLIVIATHTAEPDRTLTDQMVRLGRPHLVVRVEAARAVVGPLVIPGVSACVRCLDLVHARFDAAWPVLLAQLCRACPDPPADLRAWAVSTALLQVRAIASGTVADALGRTIEVGWDDPVLKAQTIPLHPECGCTGW